MALRRQKLPIPVPNSQLSTIGESGENWPEHQGLGELIRVKGSFPTAGSRRLIDGIQLPKRLLHFLGLGLACGLH